MGRFTIQAAIVNFVVDDHRRKGGECAPEEDVHIGGR